MVDDSSVTIFGEDSQRKRGEKELHPSLQPLFHHFFSKTRSSTMLHRTPFQESLRQACSMQYKPKCLQFCTHHDPIDDDDDCHFKTICRIQAIAQKFHFTTLQAKRDTFIFKVKIFEFSLSLKKTIIMNQVLKMQLGPFVC